VPKLIIVADDGTRQWMDLTERTVQIGRGPGNDIVLPDAHKGVSRSHAELRFRNGRCVIVDLQSQNGTFLNGARIEHAEVPFGAEIGIGSYRLKIERMGDSEGEAAALPPPPSTVGVPVTPHELEKTAFGELRIDRYDPEAEMPAAPAPPKRAGLGITVGAAALLAAAVAVWFAVGRTSPEAGEPNLPMPDLAAQPAAEPAPLPASATAELTSGAAAMRSPATADRPGLTAPTPRAATANNVYVPPLRPDQPPVARKPGETNDAWQIRTAAFQPRYAYSRAALARGDFAAAAGGFEAILREEPGYLDVPQLLVRARAGLRDVARAVFESGQRLDAAGDWLGALQKYEQAGQIHPDVGGLPDAVKRVREKLSAAGDGAFSRARRFDEAGKWTDALKEYEKAVQWLPPEDSRREMAQSRVEQLKKAIR
jgi:tetratricopeptide (TPR) repeat protein